MAFTSSKVYVPNSCTSSFSKMKNSRISKRDISSITVDPRSVHVLHDLYSLFYAIVMMLKNITATKKRQRKVSRIVSG